MMAARLVAVLLFALMLSSPAARAQTSDYTDLWFNPAESGWGVTFTQNEDLIFMTFYVYDAARQPTWYIAVTRRDANGNFSGPVYGTTGPFYGGAFDPTTVGGRTAGFASFVPTNSFQGSLSFSADGYSHDTYIERQSLANILVGGTYQTVVTGSQSGCANSANNGIFSETDQVAVSQTFNPDTLRFDFFQNGTLVCRIEGDYAQSGKLIRVPAATYTCTSGVNSQANVSDLLVTPIGIEGTWSAVTLGGCVESARFAGVLQ
jgi:hypothetical protein